ncbi:MAG: 1-acyl-sn-glycerol-3-phosphate acyltransferase, partial [Hyphomicrobiales bacterium]|nr:1-acyl-sn-glycerol-3-phosphate acyltransferase [Hyphomicrobiales bacterium]
MKPRGSTGTTTYPRLALGLSAAILFLFLCGPARSFAQSRRWRAGASTPVVFHRLLCAALGVRVRVHGRPAPAARRLIVANHVSWLDIPVLGSVAPMTFLAKKEVGAPAWGGRLARLQGLILVDRQRRRGIPRVNAEMVEAMTRGEAVVLFAEATTGDGNRILRFRSSHFEAVRQAAASQGAAGDAVVQPVFLDYSRLGGLAVERRQRPLLAWYGDMTFFGHFWRLLRAGRVVCDVHFGPPIPVSGDSRRK